MKWTMTIQKPSFPACLGGWFLYGFLIMSLLFTTVGCGGQGKHEIDPRIPLQTVSASEALRSIPIGLLELPKDWKMLAGPLGNTFRISPDKLRIDRDLLNNVAIHIPLRMPGGAK